MSEYAVPFSKKVDTWLEPTDGFPPSYIPAKLEMYRAWDISFVLAGDGKLDLAKMETTQSPGYESAVSRDSRVRWVIRAHPFAPDSDRLTIIWPDGRSALFREWTGPVTNNDGMRCMSVRGIRLMAEIYLWRPLSSIAKPGTGVGVPERRGSRGELSTSGFKELHQYNKPVWLFTDVTHSLLVASPEQSGHVEGDATSNEVD